MGKLFGGGGGTQTQTINPMPNGSGDMTGVEGDLFREMGRAFLGQANQLPRDPMYRYLPQNPNAQAAAVPQFDPQQHQQRMQQYGPQQQSGIAYIPQGPPQMQSDPSWVNPFLQRNQRGLR